MAATAAENVYYFLVFSNQSEGREAEYDAWRNTLRIKDVASVPELRTAQRLARNDSRTIARFPPHYSNTCSSTPAPPTVLRTW